MDLRQLRYFLVLAEEGQVSRAAKKLNMSQPPLSQQLRMMEEELGTTLLERKRNGKSMELTEAGKVLQEKARQLLKSWEDAMLAVQETGEGLKGQLTLGSVLAYMSYLPEKIKQFNECYPNVEFKIYAGDPYEMQNYLENKNIELAIVYLPAGVKGLAVKDLGTVPNVFVVPEGWESYQNKDSIQLKNLENVPLLLVHREKGTGIYEEIVEEFKERGIQPNILCECHDVNVLLSLVAKGLGATIVPKSAVLPNQYKGLRVLDIEDTAVRSQIGLVWRKDRYLSKMAQRFMELF